MSPLQLAARVGDEAAQLANQLQGTVVSIGYRLSKTIRYPTPVHDVLFGYDWVVKNLVRSYVGSDVNDQQAPRLGVVGTHIGGSLGAMLALTECKPWLPHIAAAALHEPMMDWPNLRLEEHSTQAGSGIYEDTKRSLALRNTIFRQPVDYFDPFASPTLFFRTPGVPVPEATNDGTDQDEFVDLAELEKLDFHRQQTQFSSLRNALTDGDTTSQHKRFATAEPTKQRRSSRRFPPMGSGLVLPNFRLTHGAGSIMARSIEDFATCVRKSMVRDSEDREQARLDVEEVVQVHCTRTSEMDVDGVADWFHDIL